MKKIKDQYLGPFKVMGIVKQKVKTPLGGEVVEVLYENRPSEIMPTKAVDMFSTSEPTDFTSLQKKRFDYLIPKLIEQMSEVDVRMFELSSLVAKVHETVTDHFERASNYLWTGDDRNWVVGINYMNNRTIMETHKVLLEMDSDENAGVTKKTIQDHTEKGD